MSLKKLWQSLWQKLWQDFKQPLQMFAIYLGATAADLLSSMNFPPGFMEQNPFARHANGQFWPAHALVQCSIDSTEFVLVALMLYCALRPLSEKLAQVLAGVPFLYYGYEHLDAAFHNILMRWPGLYVHIPTFLEKLLKEVR